MSNTARSGGLRAPGELRLAAKVAWMYHMEGTKQDAIAQELHLSQSRVSRLLKAASAEGIVVTTVIPPQGVFTELEAQVERLYHIEECVVVETRDSEDAILNDIGIAAADYLGGTALAREVIGISSWSATWLTAVRHLRPFRGQVASNIVQLVGGMGNPMVQTQATLLLDRLARAMEAQPTFMQAPGLLGDDRARDLLLSDPAIAPVADLWDQLTIVLLGIGAVEPSPLLRESGNAFPTQEMEEMVRLGAVGDICHRFFDRHGSSVDASFDGRVAGISRDQLRRVPRRIAAAGGSRKHSAIQGALRAGLVTTLITDAATAQFLVAAARP